MSLYGNLFRYRAGEARRPLEDYLTEALGDLLNRMPRAVMADFVSKLLLREEGARQNWLEITNAAGVFVWSTQRQIVSKGKQYRLDLLLEVDGCPVLVVESKVGHHVAVHVNALENGDMEVSGGDKGGRVCEANQLMTYGHWLASNPAHGSSFRALAMITHSTAPPDDFEQNSSNYGVPWTCMCRWSEVWRWLTDKSSLLDTEGANESAAWCVLSKDLAKFIEENEMSVEMLTHLDISKLEVSIGCQSRLNATFKNIADHLKSVLAENYAGRIGDVVYSEGGVIWAWIYLKPPMAPATVDWAISWGIRFPSVSEWWKEATPPLPHAPHVFVHLSGEKNKFPLSRISAGGLPLGWSAVADTSELISGESIYNFPADSIEMNKETAQWIKRRVEESFAIISLFIGGGVD